MREVHCRSEHGAQLKVSGTGVSFDLFTDNYGIGVTGKINKPDLNNYSDSDDNIYVSIYDKDNDIYYDNVLKTIAKSRIKNKKYIVKETEKMLLSILSN